jgi:hypothetical protein
MPRPPQLPQIQYFDAALKTRLQFSESFIDLSSSIMARGKELSSQMRSRICELYSVLFSQAYS